jgi:hypothetical protein
MDDTTKLIAVIALAAFATERILSALTFVLGWDLARRAGKTPEDEARMRARQKTLLFCLGGAIALAVVDVADLRIIRLLNARHAQPVADYWLTWLVLFAGADRVRDLLKDVKADRAVTRTETPAVRIRVDDVREVHQISRAS